MKHEIQEHIGYGFIDFCGNQWRDAHVDTYNRYTDRINETANREIESGSLSARDRENLLNARHYYFTTVMGIYLNDKG